MHRLSKKWHKLRGANCRKRRGRASRANAKKRWTKKKKSNKAVQKPSTDRPLSSSEKKLALFATQKENSVQDVNTDEYLLVHTSALRTLITSFYCPDCETISAVKLELAQRRGHAVLMKLVYESCGQVASKAFSSPQKVSGKNKSFSVNKNIVQSFLKLGVGYNGLLSFCSSLPMTPMSNATYYAHLSKIQEEAQQLKIEVLETSHEVVRQVHKSLNPISYMTDTIDILSAYDGSWHKRGHVSLYGLGCVIDVLIGLIIDYEILSKYCHLCSMVANDLGDDSPEYSIWYESHKESSDYSKNYEGSSGAMEVTVAEILWKRSLEECKMRYTTLLSDGDSKTFKRLQELDLYSVPLEIEECINHASKRMYSALSELVKTCKAQKVTLGGKAKGALTAVAISKLSGYYRSAVVRNQTNVEAMRKDILATLSHCSSTDDKHDHSQCPIGDTSWCFYNKAIPLKRVPPSHKTMQFFLNETVVIHMRPIYERLASPELLGRCTKGLTQNSNEAVHSMPCQSSIWVIWNLLN